MKTRAQEIAEQLSPGLRRRVGHLRALDDANPDSNGGWLAYGAEHQSRRALLNNDLVRVMAGGTVRLNALGLAVSDALVGDWRHDDERTRCADMLRRADAVEKLA